MKKAIAAMLAAAGLGLAALPAAAQQTFSNEISLFGSWEDQREPRNAEVTSLFLRYGRFVGPQLVGTGTLSRTRFEGGGNDSATTTFTVGAKYYISQPRAQAMVPFLDAAVGFANVDTGGRDSTDLAWELGGGVSWFFTGSTSFDAALRFFHTETDIETKGTRLTVGITTRF